ncbi:MAG: UbiA family prenyltransferase [Bdellovibrionota bacterium]
MIKKIRLAEILLMTGFVLIALPFLPVETLSSGHVARNSSLLFLANFLLLVAVYSANSFFGYKADRLNPRLRDHQFSSPRKYQVVTLVSLATALGLLSTLNRDLPYLGILSFLLWVFYSAPGGAKSRPYLGTLVHLVGQVLQFHLCIVAFAPPTLSTLAVSIYFGLLFASGHLMHEVKDHESDAAAGIRTNAVVFGTARLIAFYRLAVALIPVYWLLLFCAGLLNAEQFWPFFVASGAHLALTLFSPLSPGGERFQAAYRVLYFAAGVVTFATSPGWAV